MVRRKRLKRSDYFNTPAANGKDKETGLTKRQSRFVDEFLIDFHPGKAALRAGYSKNNILNAGYENLKNPNIQKAIKKRQEELKNGLEITQERILEEYAKIAFLNPKRFYNEDDTVKKITEMDDEVAAAISSFKIVSDVAGERVTEIKSINKKGALDSIAKHLGLFEKDNVLTVKLSLDKILKGLPEEIQTLLKEVLTVKMTEKKNE